MKTIVYIFPLFLAVASVAGAQAADTATRELRQAATGDSFRIGDTKFQLAPDASVAAAGQSDADGTQVLVGKYVVKMRKQAVKSSAEKNGGTAASGGQRLAAAVSDKGTPVVVTSTLNVYVTDISTLSDAVRATGGTLRYSSKAGGHGRIEYGSVGEAMKAMQAVQGLAGVKQASPEIIESENVLF